MIGSKSCSYPDGRHQVSICTSLTTTTETVRLLTSINRRPITNIHRNMPSQIASSCLSWCSNTVSSMWSKATDVHSTVCDHPSWALLAGASLLGTVAATQGYKTYQDVSAVTATCEANKSTAEQYIMGDPAQRQKIRLEQSAVASDILNLSRPLTRDERAKLAFLSSLEPSILQNTLWMRESRKERSCIRKKWNSAGTWMDGAAEAWMEGLENDLKGSKDNLVSRLDEGRVGEAGRPRRLVSVLRAPTHRLDVSRCETLLVPYRYLPSTLVYCSTRWLLQSRNLGPHVVFSENMPKRLPSPV